jgi:hypothetical protein
VDRPAEYRFELKLVLPEAHRSLLDAALRLHPMGLRMHFPPRRVNSLYFDSEGLARLDQNHAGIARRCKLRYRWYGEDLAGDGGVVELKRRRGRLGTKSLFPIAGPVDLQRMDWRELLVVLRRQLPPEGALALRAFTRPVLLNRYRRRYLATPDRRVRVTVDEDQIFLGQWGTRRPNLRHRDPAPREIVVEVKAAREDEEAVRRVLAHLPSTPARNSKYVNGCHAQIRLG